MYRSTVETRVLLLLRLYEALFFCFRECTHVYWVCTQHRERRRSAVILRFTENTTREWPRERDSENGAWNRLTDSTNIDESTLCVYPYIHCTIYIQLSYNCVLFVHKRLQIVHLPRLRSMVSGIQEVKEFARGLRDTVSLLR